MKFSARWNRRNFVAARTAAAMDQRTTFVIDHIAKSCRRLSFSGGGVFVQVTNDLSAQHHQIVDVLANSLAGRARWVRCGSGKGAESRRPASLPAARLFPGAHPRTRPFIDVAKKVNGKIQGGDAAAVRFTVMKSSSLPPSSPCGTDHDSKPLHTIFPGSFTIMPASVRTKKNQSRSRCGPARDRQLFCSGCRNRRPATIIFRSGASRFISVLGLPRLSAVLDAPRRLPPLQYRVRGGGPVG